MLAARRVLLVACLAVAVARGLAAQALRDAPLLKGALAFDGSATLGAFTGTTTTVKGQLVGAAALAAVSGWVEAPTQSLVTGNGKRDRDMYQSLETGKYPTMRFDLEHIDAGSGQGDSVAVTLHGRFTIHGTAREAAVPGWAWLRPGATRFRGALPMDVRDYGIGGLSKLLGILKMDPKLVVRIDVVFRS